MPSLRKRVSSYLRQLSFHNEPRERRQNVNENSFVTKYLQGYITLREGPPIIHGKIPTDLPNYELGPYETGFSTIKGCYSGPNGGLTTVKRAEKHLSVLDPDIDFIDTQDENVLPTSLPPPVPRKSPQRVQGQPVDNTTMMIKVAGHEYCVTNRTTKRHNKSHSLGSITDFDLEIEKTKIDREFYNNNNNNNHSNETNASPFHCEQQQDNSTVAAAAAAAAKDNVKKNAKSVKIGGATQQQQQQQRGEQRKGSNVSNGRRTSGDRTTSGQGFNPLAKSKSEGNPFQHHKKRGKIIKIAQRANSARDDDRTTEDDRTSASVPFITVDDSSLPDEWNRKSETCFGISDSLYDRNQVTKCKNGDPIADCFGVIARGDSAILAVADGVNWGEKACLAAKSAVHGCLHYLNKTVFSDTKPFDNLTVKSDEGGATAGAAGAGGGLDRPPFTGTRVGNTREIFVCLLRAFSCAHDLILENKGMLTTLTVAVVLPLKQRGGRRYDDDEGDGDDEENERKRSESATRYVCCVCNVGDTLAYVYSQKYGLRELTKGSHDISSNRDMRDALGAIGPVFGVKPELSNLTLSVTTLQRGDIVLVASDGLTDNFDPNVCRFTVNSYLPDDQTSRRPVRLCHTTQPDPEERRKKRREQRDQQQELKKKQQQQEAQKPQESRHEFPQEQHEQHGRTSTAAQTSGGNVNVNVKGIPTKPPRRVRPQGSGHSRTGSSKSSTPSIETPDETVDSLTSSATTRKSDEDDNVENNPLVAQFIRDNAVTSTPPSSGDNKKKTVVVENKASSLRRQASSSQQQNISANRKTQSQKKASDAPQVQGYKFLRSKTTIEVRNSSANFKQISRNEDGIPIIAPLQRYELQLLLIEDVLKNGISGSDSPCSTARKLCENLVNFTVSITAAKRRSLEDPELYFDNRNGLMVEVSGEQKKIRRTNRVQKIKPLPGKLDHVTVVAWNVGNYSTADA